MSARVPISVGAFVCLFAVALPRAAMADWGWIEQMSGPGPFQGIQIPFDRLFCTAKPDRTAIVQSGVHRNNDCWNNDPMKVKSFLSVEVVRAWSRKNDLFRTAGDHQIRQFAVRAIRFYRLIPELDAGVGIGVTRFSGDDFSDDPFVRVSIPLRARIIPAGWFTSNTTGWRAIFVALQADYYPTSFQSSDFGAPPGFFEDHELSRSFFLGVDTLWLFRRK